MARTTSAVAFYCRNSKKDRNGFAPLEVSISICGSRKLMNLPMKFKPEEFNRKRPPQDIVECLDLWRSKIENYKMQILKDNRVLTSESLRSVIQSGGIKSYTIKDLFEDYLHILSKRVGVDLSFPVYRKYSIVYEKVITYVDKDKEVTYLTNALVRNIVADWRATYDASTTCGYFTKLKTFIRFGIDNGHLKTNPAAGIKVTKPTKPIEYLTEDEINTIVNAHFSSLKLRKAQELFIVMLSTGMAYSDLVNYQREDLKKESNIWYISKQRVKTGHTFTAPVLSFGLPILLRYIKLPIISNQKLNAYLKIVGKELGITTTLRCHLARKSYATYLANRKVSLDAVAAAIGDNVKIASQYYAKVFQSTIIQQVSKAIDY